MNQIEQEHSALLKSVFGKMTPKLTVLLKKMGAKEEHSYSIYTTSLDVQHAGKRTLIGMANISKKAKSGYRFNVYRFYNVDKAKFLRLIKAIKSGRRFFI